MEENEKNVGTEETEGTEGTGTEEKKPEEKETRGRNRL